MYCYYLIKTQIWITFTTCSSWLLLVRCVLPQEVNHLASRGSSLAPAHRRDKYSSERRLRYKIQNTQQQWEPNAALWSSSKINCDWIIPIRNSGRKNTRITFINNTDYHAFIITIPFVSQLIFMIANRATSQRIKKQIC